MAERRMFAKSIVLSDSFLDMPMSARCLYFTLNMFADDEGFVGSPKGVMRQCGSSQDDMAILLQKKFVLSFDSGVIVIKHWRINNYLQNDRKKPTTYLEELKTLALDDTKAYTEAENGECIQSVYNLYTQDRIEENRVIECNLGESEEKDDHTQKKYGKYENVILSDDEYEKLKEEFPRDYEQKINNLSGYMKTTGKVYAGSHFAKIEMWAEEDKAKKGESSIDISNVGKNSVLDLIRQHEN